MRHPRTTGHRTARLGLLAAVLVGLTANTGCQVNPQQAAQVLTALGNAMQQANLGGSSFTPSSGVISSGNFPVVPVPSSPAPGAAPSGSYGPAPASPGNGGLPTSGDGSFQPGTTTGGILDLPVMKQSDGGSEAATRGCGPTSLLMAVGRSDPSEIQGVLVQTCDRPGGLVASRAVDWLHQNGYANAVHESNWTVERLRQETMEQRNPVVINFLNPNTGNGHIVVVTGVTSQGVHFNDPGPGSRRVLSASDFESRWAHRDEYAIPVRR